MLYITNALSINMVPAGENRFAYFGRKVSLSEAYDIIDSYRGNVEGAIGHEDTATAAAIKLRMVKDELFNRMTLSIKPGADQMIVCQYRGDRLEEGATSLPADSSLEFWYIQAG